ncbi:MAG: bifunctional oligoribonuclease/PAP phosphatase NrnA [Thermoanaerobaculia bacterium]
MIPEDLKTLVARHRRFLISSHANPDGDAIGSEIALLRLLRQAGKEAQIWNYHPTPGTYRALPDSGSIHVGSEPPTGFPAAFDCAIVLECPTLDRTGLAEAFSHLPLLNIDHHLGNSGYGVANWVDTGEPAVGVMVAALAREMGLPIDPATADCLLLALVSDTGGFRFSNATPAAFEAAATLVREGARPERVSQWLNESQPEGAVRLLGEMLGTLELHASGRIATVHITLEMFAHAGAVAGDSEGLVDSPRSIAGVEAVALLRETGPEQWKVSLRSRGPIDVQAVAQRREGGGHKNAAGCKVAGDLGTLKSALVADLAAALEVLEVRRDA